MRINEQLIKEVSKSTAIANLQYLDLSYMNIGSIENLDACVNLRVLILKGNQIDAIDNGLEKCKQLWKLDLSHNRVKNLDGIVKFVAFGSLNLSCNGLNWKELEKIRHVHIVDLSVVGNLAFDKDPNSRAHLIDCLPNVWLLDGLLVTSSEKEEVDYFLENSKYFLKPIRRKLPKDHFTPTERKYHSVHGIYGEWTTNMFIKFPTNCIQQNIIKDKRKLEFLCTWFEYLIEIKHQQDNKLNFDLNELLKYRLSNSESCNMILVLLIASLHFLIPIQFIHDTLEFIKLKTINDIATIEIFLSPKPCKLYIAMLLLSTAKLDIDDETNNNFYENLFESLHTLLKEQLSLTEKDPLSNDYSYYTIVNNTKFKEAKILITTELLQLFSIIPEFYNQLTENEGLASVMKLCFGNAKVYNTIINMIKDLRNQDKTSEDVCREMNPLLMNLLKANAKNILNKKPKQNKRSGSKFIEKRMKSLLKATSHAASAHDNSTTSKSESTKVPRIGDNMLIGPQSMGRIVTIPQTTICLIQFDYLLGVNGSMGNFGQPGDHFLYANLEYFEWDDGKKFWRPRGSTGDRITFQYDEDLFEKKLIWSLTNSSKYSEDSRGVEFLTSNLTELPNGHNNTTNEDDLSEIYSERVPPTDNISTRTKSTSSLFFKERNNTKLSASPKKTILDLDVNLPIPSVTPLASPLPTYTLLNNKKQKRVQIDKENVQIMNMKNPTANHAQTTSRYFDDNSDNSNKIDLFINGTEIHESARVEKRMSNLNTDSTRGADLKMSPFDRQQTIIAASTSDLPNVVYQNSNNFNSHSQNNFGLESMQLHNESIDTSRFDFKPDNTKRLKNKYRLSARYSRQQSSLQQQQQQQNPQSRPSSPSQSSNASYLNYTDDKHRKPINVQNCSSWLATCQLNDYKQNLTSYIDKYNHINLVMNLKSNTRANTEPKMPNLTSPSSKAHERYKGLRPSTASNAKLVVDARKFYI